MGLEKELNVIRNTWDDSTWKIIKSDGEWGIELSDDLKFNKMFFNK